MEELAAIYVEVLWENGRSKNEAQYAMAAIQYSLRRRRILVEAWELLAAWRLNEPPNRMPPMPPEGALALAGSALAQMRPDICAVVLIGFHVVLRTSEMCGLRAGHFILNQEFTCALALPRTKGGQWCGAMENITIEDATVGRWLRSASTGLSPGDLLLRCTTDY